MWMLAGLVLPAGAAAQQPTQGVRPPVSQAWIDVATFGGMGLPMGLPGGGNPMAMLGGLLRGGAGSGGNTFGQTQAMSPGRWVDVTLYTRNNPSSKRPNRPCRQAS
ncbi:MAG: hypothetical protein IPN37_10350 [Betaproteobacteria bacterium]|nr:hypothetical protein [Betaproteobacteria bacterium]